MMKTLLTARVGKIWTSLRPRAAAAREIISATLDGFSRDRGDLVAAGLAFYTLLSIAPLIIIAVAIAGWVLGEGAARREVARLLNQTMGTDAASAVEDWVDQAAAGGGLASVVGVALLLFAASRLGSQLRNALNQIWNVEVVGPDRLRSKVADYLRQRAFALVLVLASGPLLLLVVASRALLSGFHRLLFADSPWSGVAVHALQLSFSLSIVALISAAIFRFVPDRRVCWRSAGWGAVLTSVLFNAGNVLVGLYLGRASVSAAYGAAGSAVVLLLWLQFSAHMFLLGAEFTQRLSERFSCELARPVPDAAAPAPSDPPEARRRAFTRADLPG